MFVNSDSAFRFIGITYILFGMLLPLCLTLAVGIVSVGSLQAMEWTNALCFFVDPFYSFFDGVKDLIYIYLSKKYADQIYHIRLTKNLDVTTWLSCTTMIAQAVVYMIAVIAKDSKDCNQFKKVGGNDGKLQPQLNVYTDILDHEKTIRNAANDNEFMIKAVDLKKTYP
jgi:ATP-binding cassette, subfamily A (ABC1), member 3